MRINHKRTMVIFLGLVAFYGILWALTGLLGVPTAYKDKDSLERMLKDNWRGPVRVDHDLVQAGERDRPVEWYYRSRGYSPAPFVVVSSWAQEGYRGGIGERKVDFWFFGYLHRITDSLLWETNRSPGTQSSPAGDP